MTKKPYKGNYKGTIDVHRHTKVRRPKSRWKLWVFPYQPILNKVEGVNYVQDISKGLENPLDLKWPLKNIPYMMKQEFLTPKEFEEMTSPKPSLLTRVKERFKL